MRRDLQWELILVVTGLVTVTAVCLGIYAVTFIWN